MVHVDSNEVVVMAKPRQHSPHGRLEVLLKWRIRLALYRRFHDRQGALDGDLSGQIHHPHATRVNDSRFNDLQPQCAHWLLCAVIKA